jgi:sulfur-oxidizing protein SoxY
MLRPLNRRAALAGAGAMTATAAVLLAGGGLARAEEEAMAPPSPQFDEALKTALGGVAPDTQSEDLTIDLPETAENGNIVPYKLEVASPMTEADHVDRLYLLSTANPQAQVAVFHFTPQSGKATVSGRMRLAKTQAVVAVAVTSTGRVLQASRNIDVLVGGCGNE